MLDTLPPCTVPWHVPQCRHVRFLLGHMLQHAAQQLRHACRPESDLYLMRGGTFFDAATAARDAGAILDYLRALPAGVARPQTYQRAISAARALRDQRVVFAVLDTMEEQGVAPDAHHWSNALAVCKATGDVDVAFQRFGQMTAEGTPADAHVLTALVAACAAHIRKLRDERRRARAASLAGRLEVRRQPCRTLPVLPSLELQLGGRVHRACVLRGVRGDMGSAVKSVVRGCTEPLALIELQSMHTAHSMSCGVPAPGTACFARCIAADL